GDPARTRNIAQRAQITGPQDDLAVRRPARLLKSHDLIIQTLPLTAEYVRPRDYDINLVRARRNRAPDFREALLQCIQARWKAGGDGRDADVGSLQRAPGCLHEQMVDTHGGHLNRKILDAKGLSHAVRHRLHRLRAQTPHAFLRVVPGESREVHAGNSPQEPGYLPILFDRSPRSQGSRATLNGAGVHPNTLNPIEVERHPGIHVRARTSSANPVRKQANIAASSFDVPEGASRNSFQMNTPQKAAIMVAPWPNP